MKTKVLVLAAGRSTRIKDPMTKMLHQLGEKRILERVLHNVKEAGFDDITLVLGHQRDLIVKELPDYKYVVQDEQLGTGHAVLCAVKNVAEVNDDLGDFTSDTNYLVLFGDKPLLRPQTIREFVESHEKSKRVITCSTVIHPIPENYSEGYGTVVRVQDQLGNMRIIALRKIEDTTECDGGMYIFKAEWLWNNIRKLKAHDINGKVEYYLPDLIELATYGGDIVNEYRIKDYKEATGINTPEQKLEAEKYLNEGI
jgi:bifunctional UDP-N-acetylglucosamine pyrophosphorylase / glucosamine-1-phosphate N-acetyltransferase